jgi:predicted metal-dependent hydrolase
MMVVYVDVRRIAEEYRRQLGIEGEVRVVVGSYRGAAAFADLRTRTIYVNGRLLGLGERVVRYLVLHELVHIKLNTRYHGSEFYELLHRFFPPEEVEQIRRVALKYLINTL